MGSTKPKEVLNEKEVSMLLNRPRSQLAEIWKRDALSQWASTLNEPPKTYAPTSHIQKKVSEVILSGEKCNQCKTRRKKCIGVSLYRILFSKKTNTICPPLVLYFEHPKMVEATPAAQANYKGQLQRVEGVEF